MMLTEDSKGSGAFTWRSGGTQRGQWTWAYTGGYTRANGRYFCILATLIIIAVNHRAASDGVIKKD